MDSLETLQRHYQQPLLAARQAHGRGIAVVGLTGPTIPVEVALALNLFPVRISPIAGQVTPTADQYMDSMITPDAKSLFESAIRGDFEFLDLLVLSRGEDKLYYFLKEMLRLGRARSLPTLHMFDLMGSQREAVEPYNRQHFEWLIAALERVASRRLTQQALSSAIAQTNRSRALQRRLLELRWQHRVPGSEALEVIGAGFAMHPAEYADALQDYLEQRATAPQAGPERPRVLIATSEPLSHLSLHRQLEQAGAFVAAEDDPWGSRAPGEDPSPDADAHHALFRKYWLDTAHAGVHPRAAREAWFMQMLGRSDLDGVVFYIPPGDHLFGWDYPRLAARVKEAGKRSLLLRQDARVDASIAAPIAQFVAALRAPRSTV